MLAINDKTANTRRTNRNAALFWGTVIIGLLASQIAVGVVSVVLAVSDPSFAVVPDYHQKALKWDEAVAAKTASTKLGWICEITLSNAADNRGDRTLVACLKNKDGQSINDAKVQLQTYHHARANELLERTLRFIDDGFYAVELPMKRNGLWEVNLVATRDSGERFEQATTLNTLVSQP